MVEGAGASHDAEYQGIVMPEDIAVCEKAITLMTVLLKRAVKNKYLYRVPTAEGCKRCHCSEEDYKQRIAAAQFIVIELVV